jgi:hypothetical protein
MSLLDYTNKDYASLRAALLKLASEKLPEWTDQSPNDLGVMLLELVAYMGDSLFYNQDRIAGESFLGTAVERRSLVQLLRLIGYELKPPLAASADLTLLFKLGTTGPVTIPQFAAFKTTAAVTGVPISFQYIQPRPITFDRGALPFGIVDAKGALTVLPAGAPLPAPLPAGSTGYLAYQTIPVVQIDANVTGEVVASSDGTPRQRYALKRAPVVDDSLVVSVNEGGGPAVWTLVSSLVTSGNNDLHYSVRRDEHEVVWIEFGDGTYGKVPRRGSNNITATYSVGGGAKGNVPLYAISKAVTSIDALKLVSNARAASGGADAEAAADAVERGPHLFRSMGRAVTTSDYEVLAKNFGVGKALAQAAAWNNILLIIAPAGGGVVSDTLKEDLLAFLDEKRIMTSLIQIVEPTYVQVLIDATVTVLPQFSRRLVQQQVEAAVQKLFAFDNVDFGQTMYISKVYEVIQDLPGVQGAVISTFARKDTYDPSAPSPSSGQLAFVAAQGEIPIWTGFTQVPSLPLPTPDGDPRSHLAMLGGVTNG